MGHPSEPGQLRASNALTGRRRDGLPVVGHGRAVRAVDQYPGRQRANIGGGWGDFFLISVAIGTFLYRTVFGEKAQRVIVAFFFILKKSLGVRLRDLRARG